MAKNKFWMLTATLTCGLMLTACVANEDNVSVRPTAEEENYEEFPELPTTDQLTTLIERPAYVFDANYTGEGKAVVARATKKVAFSDESLEVVVMHNSQIKQLTNEDYLNIIRVIAKGGSIVFVEPLLADLDYFCQYVAAAVYTYSGASEIVAEYLPADAIRRICQWSEATPFADMIEDEVNDRYEIIALRGQTVYLSMNDREGVPTKQTIDIEVEKEGKEGEYEIVSVEVENPNDLNDYYFGRKADDMAAWLNSDEPETTEEEAAEVQALIARRAGGDATLQTISKAQTFILRGDNHELYFQPTAGRTDGINHPIQLRYDVWTAYSADKKCDFYCVKLNVTAENDKLGCGPSGKRDWYDPQYFPLWKASQKVIKTPIPGAGMEAEETQGPVRKIYGPYMRELKMDCSLQDLKCQLVDYTPKNNTSGGVTVMESFSASLGANVGASSSGPMGNLSGQLTWGSSVSRFNPDLRASVSANTSTGQLQFGYIAGRPIAEYNLFSDAHTGTKDISIKTCTVQHAWVWQVQSTAADVKLNTRFKVVDEWLTYTKDVFACREVYLPVPYEHKFKSTVICPPRNKQEWAMTIEPANSKAEAYLAQKLPQYFWHNNVFFTRKENHLKADSKDEISTWVQKSRTIFDKNNSILKGAAQEGGITGKYIIRWHQTNGTGGQDNDFTYEVKL